MACWLLAYLNSGIDPNWWAIIAANGNGYMPFNNALPSPGGFAGWICTASGAPGTWKGFGAISA